MTATVENALKVYVALDQAAVLSWEEGGEHSCINHGHIGHLY